MNFLAPQIYNPGTQIEIKDETNPDLFYVVSGELSLTLRPIVEHCNN